MDRLRPLERELEYQITALGISNVRLSMMSVFVPALPLAVVASTVRAAAAPSDLVGMLEDRTIGVLCSRALGPDGGQGVEDRFLPRLQSLLLTLCRHRALDLTIRFRAVHLWASELSDADDLVNLLFDMPVRMVPLISSPPRRNGLARRW